MLFCVDSGLDRDQTIVHNDVDVVVNSSVILLQFQDTESPS